MMTCDCDGRDSSLSMALCDLNHQSDTHLLLSVLLCGLQLPLVKQQAGGLLVHFLFADAVLPAAERQLWRQLLNQGLAGRLEELA